MMSLWRSFVLFIPVWMGAVWIGTVSSASAQQPAPAPQAYAIPARDGTQIAVTYYPSRERAGTAEAKQVAPVILLHDFQDTRASFASLAQRLQSPGGEGEGGTGTSFAVVTVDLRGHGESTRRIGGGGFEEAIDPTKMARGDFFAMATIDMEAVRSFLVGKNDDGELNLNKLCLIGTGLGANVAVNWAANDWTAPPLAIGKQGQDVRGVVLISPRWTAHGLSMQDPMKVRPLKSSAAWMLIYGSEDAKVKADADRIYKQLERFHRGEGTDGAVTGLVSLPWSSNLQGSTLLRQGGAEIEDRIVAFLTENVATRDFPWIARRTRRP